MYASVLYIASAILCVFYGQDQFLTSVNYAPQPPAVEDGVYVGNQMPQWGEICEATDIYGNPRVPVDVYGLLSVGEIVPLHDLTMVGDVAWVSIHKARWIPLDAVCDW